MIEAVVLIAAVCLLAVVIDHFRSFEITAMQCVMFARGDRIGVVGLRGERYKVVTIYADRNVIRVRRILG